MMPCLISLFWETVGSTATLWILDDNGDSLRAVDTEEADKFAIHRDIGERYRHEYIKVWHGI